ncbi:MAG: Uma2 family endonuclease [Caldilineaceae bacterium]|nr:Uma2 family endonuclease [Caldilineaceae bacterium]
MSPNGSRHAACVKRLTQLLVHQLGEQAIIGVQDPVQLDTYSVPEPDLSVLTYREDFYAQAHPTAEDVLLLIAVADSSLETDQAVKLPIYARAGIPEVWLVDVDAGGDRRLPDPIGQRLSTAPTLPAWATHLRLGWIGHHRCRR